MDQDNQPQPGPDDNKPQRFTDEITERKIDRNLHDINDTISEDDIKNISTNVNRSHIPGDKEPAPEEEPVRNDKKQGDTVDNKDKLPTSWNILG